MNIKPLADRVLILPAPAECCMASMPVLNWKLKEPNISSCVKVTYSLYWDNKFIK